MGAKIDSPDKAFATSYKKHGAEPRLSGLEEFTNHQLFFIGFASYNKFFNITRTRKKVNTICSTLAQKLHCGAQIQFSLSLIVVLGLIGVFFFGRDVLFSAFASGIETVVFWSGSATQV
ncbi:hypothetical protein Y032_0105g3717 [Ancylostoma ceylanicum]|uniref:Uncharacterized protein n=1 Tax=Ancylostoma ceylanicum TaxID=53326 RepID=A0A016TGE0_9BILA|nr:hypothetical protein Y032_0105g3717 [Ancylostoma ceylanicum]